MITNKNAIIIFIIISLFLSMFILSSAATEVTLSIDGEVLDSANNPILEDGRTIAPVRVISEYLGGYVSWDGSTKTVSINKGSNHIQLTINNSTVTRDGETLDLNIPPQLINGKTYVPLRFVSEVLEYEVGWNNDLKRVELNTPEVPEEDNNNDDTENEDTENEKFVIKDITKLKIENDYAAFIDVDENVKYRTTVLPNPDRYVIDFVNTEFSVNKSQLDSNGVLHLNSFGEYIESVRASQFQISPLTSRVVLDLTDIKGYPHIEKIDGKLAIYYSKDPNGNTIEPNTSNDNEDNPDDENNNDDQELEFGLTNHSFEIDTTQEVEYELKGLVDDKEDIYGVISSAKVNVRSEPSTADGDTVVATLDGGTKLEVTGQTSGWYQIIYKNQSVWVADWLLDIELELKRDNVNVRSGPGLNYSVVDTIPRGSMITVNERQPDWVKVTTEDNKTGYIADYLVGLNDRLLNGVNQSDSVAEQIEITIKDTHKSDISLSNLPDIVINNEIISQGSDTIVKLTLGQPIAFRHKQVEDKIQVNLGSVLENVRVTEDPGKVTVEMFFDLPARFTIYQNQLKDNLMLDLLYTASKQEQTFELEGEIASKVFTTNSSDSTELNVTIGDIGTYKLNTTGYSDYVKLELLSSSLDGKVIALDPGHGGKDPGARSGGINESDINLDVALKVRDILLDKGVTVVMTRDSDKSVTLGERTNFANEMNADIAISFHTNSTRYGTASGVETIYYPKAENQRLAKAIQDALVTATRFRSRGIKPWPEIFFTQHTLMPSVLLEMGFINNSSERAFLVSESGQDEIARNIVAAIERFFLYQ